MRRALPMLALAATLATPARAEEPAAAAPVRTADGLEALVPALAAHPWRIADGPRPYQHRLAFSPGYGLLGEEPLFVVRAAYMPDAWLGWEASLGHNPGRSVHAAVHQVSALLRRPRPGRVQPYAALGFGMVLVFPGSSVNASPVTRNALTYGGGLELFLRDDLALRADVRQATVIGGERDRDGVVAWNYLQSTLGLSFYRSMRP
jgi:hypothetical protein